MTAPINLTGYDKDGEGRCGYLTGRGRFVRYDEQNIPHLDRDCTISELLARIYVQSGCAIQSDFAYFDQSNTLSVLPHRFAGITDLKTGDDDPDFGLGPA